MPIACDAQSLSLAAGVLYQFTEKELKALEVLYLYRQLNPTSTGVVPAATLLQNASCLVCSTGDGGDDQMLAAMQVWIQRQRAIDSGLPAGAFNANLARAHATPLCNLNDHQLDAIATWLKCQLS